MPSSRETVINLALSGDELKDIIRADIDRLLAAEGALTTNSAYGKVAYVLALKLYLDNPYFPESLTRVGSLPATIQQVEGKPSLAALQRPPLPVSDQRSVGGTAMRREIISPNAERVRLGMPVPVLVQQQDGTRTVEGVRYPPEITGVEDDGLHVVDESEARRLGWNIIEVEE